MKQIGLIPKEEESLYPKWYRASKYRRAANLRVLHGLHPLGGNIGTSQSKCRDCSFLVDCGWYKCSKIKITSSIASDVRLKWRGCDKFDRKDKSTKWTIENRICPSCDSALHEVDGLDAIGCNSCGAMYDLDTEL